MVISPSGMSQSGEMAITLGYDPSRIPRGFSENDLKMLVFSPASQTWRPMGFEGVKTGEIRFATNSASAFALVLPTTGTASPIIGVQPDFNPGENRIRISGEALLDVTAAPTLLVPQDRLNQTGFLFFCIQFDSGLLYCHENRSQDFENPTPEWVRIAPGDAIFPFEKRVLDNPQLTFDVNLANMNLAGAPWSGVNVYFAFAPEQNPADFHGASYVLNFE